MTDAVRSTTLEELIQRVAFRLGDAMFLESTNTGSTTELIDRLNIPMGGQELTRRQMVFLSGDERGEVVVIQGTNPVSHAVQFSPEVGVAVPAGVLALVINKQGGGYSYTEYKRAINMAIDDAYPHHRTKIDASFAFDAALGYMTIGSTIGEVYAVDYQDTDARWVPVPAAPHFGYDGWWVDRALGRVVVSGQYILDYVDGYTVRIRGEGRQPQLSTYSESTKLHPGWIVPQAAWHLAMMGMDRDLSGQRARQVLSFQQEAMERLPLIRVYREPESSLGRE